MKRANLGSRKSIATHREAPLKKSDAKALALIKDSGILNPNAKLEEILKVTQQLGISTLGAVQEQGHIFIFREVVFIKCPF